MSRTFDIDAREIAKAADDLRNRAPKQMLKAVREITIAETKVIQAKAKADAPRDRPWLATQGIRRRTKTYGDAIVGTVFTVVDPRRRPVGFFVLYGTASTPPVDFMTPAFMASEGTYGPKILAALDPFTTTGGGGDVGGDEGDG